MTVLEETSQKFPKLPLPTLLRRLNVAKDIFTKKRVPFTKLAAKYEVSRRTIYEDVEWIRSNFNIELIQKAVQDKVAIALDEVVNPMVILKYGLPFLAKAITQKSEVHEEIKTEHRTDIHVALERYEEVIERVANRDLQKNNPRKQVHTVSATSNNR